MAEADDAQSWRRGELELRRRTHAVGQVARERDVLGDSVADAIEAGLLHRHPHLQRAEAPRLLESVLAEPGKTVDTGRTAGTADVRRDEAEGRTHGVGVADRDETGFDRNEHPLVRIERDAVG